MTHTITLELSDETMQKVAKVAQESGNSIQATLQGWINQTVKTVDAMTILQQATELPIYTPFGGEQTAQELLVYGEQLRAERRSSQDHS